MTETASSENTASLKEVTLCSDGSYRWSHEFHMYRNPAVFLTCLRVVWFSLGIVFLFVVLLSIGDGDFLGSLWGSAKVFLLLGLVLSVLCGLAYVIVAWRYGGKYCVLFTMDERGIDHTQLASQVKQYEVLGFITMIAGAAANKPGTVGTGLLAMSRGGLYSPYIDVREIIADKKHGVIKVNGRLKHNQIYVCDEDFDFVEQYLRQHVEAARKAKN